MNIYFYKAIISYKGTRYCGWQINRPNLSIQEEIMMALCKICKVKIEEVKVIGSGRTDSKVHALGQVCKFEIPLSINPNSLKRGLNSQLPNDIKVCSVDNCENSFHPIFSAKKKEYQYFFSTKEITPFMDDMIGCFSFKLDIELMKEGAKLFLGEHDFKNFFCKGTDVSSTVRTIFSVVIVNCSSKSRLESSPEQFSLFDNFINDYYCFQITGSGFLKQMVRLMMGTLITLGRGNISLDNLREAIEGDGKSFVGPTAPPYGLYLFKVEY